MVDSATRNARAISAVLSPPSSRSVSATWALVASAGWQQVKISRSRSSGTLVFSVSLSACNSAAWACLSARGLPAEAVDGPVAGRGDDPARRARRQPVGGPPGHGRGERLLHGFLGDVDVTEHADQDGDRAAVLGPEHALYLGAGPRVR